MSLHNFNSNTKSWKMYTNTLTSISGDDLLVVPSYGKDLILEVSANNDIFFKKGDITKGFGNIVSDYLDVSFVREASFNSLNSQMQYVLQEISGISNDLLDTSYNIILSGGVFIQNNEYASYDILDITGKIIFTDNSTNVQRINDISLNNVDICGSLNVAGSISASNIYTKTEIDASLSNVYTKLDVLDSSLANVITHIDASFSNVYTKGEINTSFVVKELLDISLINVYNKLDVLDVSLANVISYVDASFSNVYTKLDVLDVSLANVITHVDASFSNVYTKLDALDSSLANVITYVDASFSNVYNKLDVLDLSLGNVITYVDASFSNVYTKLDVLDSSLDNVITYVDASFSNVYTKLDVLDVSLANVITYVDASFSNVYTKLDVLDSSLANVITYVDASFSIVYTKAEVDVSFVSKELFDASLNSIQLSNVYTKAEVDVSFVSKELFETSYNFLLSSVGTSNESGDGGYFQNNDYASYDILNITDTIIFTDNSNNEINNDVSFNNVDISGALNVAGSISAPNIYIKTEIDASFTNVYSKLDVLDSSLANVIIHVDASFLNVYTRDQVDLSFVSKELFDASLSSIQVSNVYTKNEVDVSFVSKQLFETSYNVLLSAIGTGGGGGSGSGSGSGSSTLKFSNNLWNKLGFDISGSGNDNLGSKIALSDDGTTIAVAVPNDDTNGTDFGAVIIYKYINYNWRQLGNKIAVSPAATNGSYASELAISGNGTIIAFLYNYDIYEDINYGGTIYNELISYSVVKSFSYNNIVWNETGSVSIASKNYHGNSYSPYTSMSFSRDGSTLAMGRWGADANRGETYVYKFIDSSWNKYGPTIIPPFTGLAAGFKVSLSSNGNIIAVGNWDGSSWPNTTLSRAGSVIVYSYYSNTWNIMGEIIRGKKSYDQGYYIKLSGDGQILAIGASGVDNYDNGLDSGAAYIYKYNTTDNSWNQLGQTIIPFAELHFEENTYTYFGASIALSVDGNTIAITQSGYDGEIFTSPNAGRCIVYKYINNYWSQYGQYIPGFEYEGSSDIALSSDGATLAYSSQNFKNGIGRVRVFGINNVSSSSSSSSSSSGSSSTFDALFASSLTINNNIVPFVNNTSSLGTSAIRWSNIFTTNLNVTGTFTNTSDDRLKHNEVIIVNGLDVIDKLNPKFYQKTLTMLDASYNGDLSAHSWSYETGLIAQDLLQINDLSFVVSGGDYYEESYIYKRQTNDPSNTNYDPSGNNYDICYNLIIQTYNVNYNSIFVYGLAAIKELHTKVKSQETTISSLIGRIELLETTISSLIARIELLETNPNSI